MTTKNAAATTSVAHARERHDECEIRLLCHVILSFESCANWDGYEIPAVVLRCLGNLRCLQIIHADD
jgi:hypothetical protein